MKNHRQTCAFCGRRFLGADTENLTVILQKLKSEPRSQYDFETIERNGPVCKRCTKKAEALLRK